MIASKKCSRSLARTALLGCAGLFFGFGYSGQRALADDADANDRTAATGGPTSARHKSKNAGPNLDLSGFPAVPKNSLGEYVSPAIEVGSAESSKATELKAEPLGDPHALRTSSFETLAIISTVSAQKLREYVQDEVISGSDSGPGGPDKISECVNSFVRYRSADVFGFHGYDSGDVDVTTCYGGVNDAYVIGEKTRIRFTGATRLSVGGKVQDLTGMTMAEVDRITSSAKTYEIADVEQRIFLQSGIDRERRVPRHSRVTVLQESDPGSPCYRALKLTRYEESPCRVYVRRTQFDGAGKVFQDMIKTTANKGDLISSGARKGPYAFDEGSELQLRYHNWTGKVFFHGDAASPTYSLTNGSETVANKQRRKPRGDKTGPGDKVAH